MCLDERARVARVVRVWERALLTLNPSAVFVAFGQQTIVRPDRSDASAA